MLLMFPSIGIVLNTNSLCNRPQAYRQIKTWLDLTSTHTHTHTPRSPHPTPPSHRLSDVVAVGSWCLKHSNFRGKRDKSCVTLSRYNSIAYLPSVVRVDSCSRRSVKRPTSSAAGELVLPNVCFCLKAYKKWTFSFCCGRRPCCLCAAAVVLVADGVVVVDDRFFSFFFFYILRSRADSLRSHVILRQWIAFYSAFLTIHRRGVLTALTWLVPHETAAVSARSVYTIQPCSMSLHAKPDTQGVCVFSCNLPPALLAEWARSFTCYYGNTGVERIPK